MVLARAKLIHGTAVRPALQEWRDMPLRDRTHAFYNLMRVHPDKLQEAVRLPVSRAQLGTLPRLRAGSESLTLKDVVGVVTHNAGSIPRLDSEFEESSEPSSEEKKHEKKREIMSLTRSPKGLSEVRHVFEVSRRMAVSNSHEIGTTGFVTPEVHAAKARELAAVVRHLDAVIEHYGERLDGKNALALVKDSSPTATTTSRT